MAGGTRSSGIAVIGSGVAGLHLALLLQKQQIPATLYSDQSAAQLASGRMANTVAHHDTTVRREQALGVDHWDRDEYGYFCHHHYLGGPRPLSFPGAFRAPSRAIDYRVYLPRLLADFQERGGDFRGKLRAHHPQVLERVDVARFGLTRPQDLLQGAVTPVLREDYAVWPNGKIIVAVGDAHSVVDPVVGQGANSASYSAWELGTVIAEDPNFDQRFARKVAARRAGRVRAISDWTNLMIGLPPAARLLRLFGAMSQDPDVADEFTDNFNQPERQWDILATPERTSAFLARHGL